MKSFVINLARQTEKLEQFMHNAQYLDDLSIVPAVDGREVTYEKLKEMGFDTNKNWRDPILKRTLTKGEIGCFLSHWKVWEKCAQGDEPFLVFEDDVVMTGPLPADIDKHVSQADILFLLWNEMRGGGVVDHGTYKELCYRTGFVHLSTRSPIACRVCAAESIFPTDELVPYMGDRLKLHGLVNAPCELRTKGSSTEPSSHDDYFIDFDTHVLTVASDVVRQTSSTRALRTTVLLSRTYGLKIRRDGGLTNFSTGGGIKFNLLRKELNKLPDHVLMTDAYDVFFGHSLNEITRRYLSFKTEVVVQAEATIWPDCSLLFPPSVTPYRYICSGILMGRVKELKKILDVKLANDESDQLFLQKQFLTGHYSINLTMSTISLLLTI